jgi:hypothetical protein
MFRPSGHSGFGKRRSDIPHSAPRADQQGEASPSGDRGKGKTRYQFLRVARAALTPKRKKWRCPRCRRRFRIPVDHDPELCPECREHGPASPATAEKSKKILLEPADPFVEFLSRFTGHRFSHERLFKSAIAVAIVIAVSVIEFVREETHWAVAQRDVAKAEPIAPDAGPLLTAPARSVPATQPQPAAILEPPSAAVVAVRPGHPQEHGEQSRQDGDLIAVRAWLKENQDDPHWEELKWWPSKPVDDDLVTYAGLLKSDRVARLKYRITDQDGTQQLRDDVFVFRENRVRAVPGGDNLWWDEWGGWTGLILQGGRRLLPDGEHEQIPSIASATKLLPNAASGKPVNAQAGHPSSDVMGKQRERIGKTASSSRARQSRANRTKGHKAVEPWWAKIDDDADLDQVRAWLKDNLPDWEEIRWWKPLDFVEYRWSTNPPRSAVVLLDWSGHPSRFVAGRGLPPDRVTREHVCRVKIRAKDQSKTAKVEDRLFLLDNGKVEPLLDPSHKRHEWKYFPDAAGAKPKPAE